MLSTAAHIHVTVTEASQVAFPHAGSTWCLHCPHTLRAPTWSADPAEILHMCAFLLKSHFSYLLCHCEASKLSFELRCTLYSDIMQTKRRKRRCLGKTLPVGSPSINLVSFTTKVSTSSPPALPTVNLPAPFIITQILFPRAWTHCNSFSFLTSQQRTILIYLSSNSLSKINHNDFKSDKPRSDLQC